MTRHARIEIVPQFTVMVERNDGTREWVRGGKASDPHFLRLRASNGVILAHSEVYASKSNARRAVAVWLDAMDSILGGRGAGWTPGGYVIEVDHQDEP